MSLSSPFFWENCSQEKMRILSDMLVNGFQQLIELILWLSLLIFLVGGWTLNQVMGLVVGFLLWLVIMSVFCSLFIMVYDIRIRLKNIEKSASLGKKENNTN